MADGVCTKEGLCQQLDIVLRASVSGLLPWQLLLYSVPITVTRNTVLADVTECNFYGYSRATLTRSFWTPAVLVGDIAISEFGAVPYKWSNLGSFAQLVAGYAILDQFDGTTRYVQTFDGADRILVKPGDPYSLLATYTMGSRFP